VIQIDVRILRISWIGTDFFYFFAGNKAFGSNKSVPIREIRKIRTSICITMYHNL
jgi:hypothetical protein